MADDDFDFSLYDTNPQDGVITPNELVVVLVSGQNDGNNHRAEFRSLSEFVPGSVRQFTETDPVTGFTYIAERGQLTGQSGLVRYRHLYYAHPHPSLSNWSGADARNNFVSLSQARAVMAASNTTSIVITSANHGLNTGDRVYVFGVNGNTAANGNHRITRVDAQSIPARWN